MKRSNLLWAVALLLAGCSNSDELGGNPEVSENAITFDQPFVRKSTRATGDLNTTTITATTIRVWGDKHTASGGTVENVFDATSASDADVSATLSCTGADKSWACSKIAFWEATYAYDFTAVAPSDVTATYPTTETTLADRKLTVSSIPVVQTISNADGSKQGDDILVANANNLTAGGVQLSFKHILSRFSVYAYTKVETTVSPITITALKLYLPVSTATATYAQNTHGTVTAGSDAWTWTGFGNKENATATTELVTDYTGYDIVTTATGALPVCSTPAAAAEKTGGALLLPQEFFIAPTAVTALPTTADLQLYMDITFTYKDKEYSRTCVPVQDLHSFTQGYQTNLYICVNEPKQAIFFNNMSVDGWTDDDHTATVNE